MRNRYSFVLFLGVIFSCPVRGSELTPLSETNPYQISPNENAEFSPLMQACINQLRSVKADREESLVNIVLKSHEYQDFTYKKTLAEALEVAGISAVVAAGTKAVYNALSPSVVGMIASYPSIAEKFDTISAKLPESPYIYPAVAVSLSTLAAFGYARNKLSQPAQLDEKTLAIVTDFDTAQNNRLDIKVKHLGLLYDTLMVEQDDLGIFDELLPKLRNALTDIQHQISQGKENTYTDQTKKLSENVKNLDTLVKKITDLSAAQHELEPTDTAKKGELPLVLPKRKSHRKTAALLTAIGLGAGHKASPLTRGQVMGTFNLDPIAVLALCAGGTLEAAHVIQENIFTSYHTKLRKKLTDRENEKTSDLKKMMEEFTLEHLAEHQELVRQEGQKIDLEGLDAEQIRNKLKSYLKKELSSNDIHALIKHQEDMTQTAWKLLQLHAEKKKIIK